MSEPASVAVLLQRIVDLETALRPFAELASVFDGRPDAVAIASTWRGSIVVRDLRRAREALA
jgi:hypothetical protein